MATSWIKVFDSFMNKIEDVDLASLELEDQIEDLKGFLYEALTYIAMSDLTLDSNLNEMNEIRMEFEDDLSIFEVELIAKYMVVAWYSRQVNSLQHTNLFVGTTGERFTDQNQHLKQILAAREYWEVEARKQYRNKHILNNDYFDKK